MHLYLSGITGIDTKTNSDHNHFVVYSEYPQVELVPVDDMTRSLDHISGFCDGISNSNSTYKVVVIQNTEHILYLQQFIYDELGDEFYDSDAGIPLA